jgi:hypothetical protein
VQSGSVSWKQIVEVKSEERRVGTHVEAQLHRARFVCF